MIRLASNATGLARQIEALGGNVSRLQLRRMQRWGASVNRKLKTIAGKHVAHGVTSRISLRGREPITTFTSRSNIGWWREFGTGLYGPLRRRIRSKGGPYVDAHGKLRNRRALQIPVAGGFIYYASVRGMKARPWFVRTVKAEIPRLLRETVEDFNRAIRRLSAPVQRR